jgi:hypothetical protein
MSGPVDVMAVLSGLEGVFQDMPSRDGSMADAEALALAAAMVTTRAAVAELIEAAKYAEADEYTRRACVRLRAALANAGSAS